MKTAIVRDGIYGNFDVLIYENGVLVNTLLSCAPTRAAAQAIADKIVKGL